MKIAVDAGALCAPKNQRYGNYVVTDNLIKALLKYDKENQYFFYSFCPKKGTLFLKPKIFWSTLRISWEELLNKKDYYFALNQAIPLFTPAKIISFSHGLAFYFYPKLYPDSAKKMKRQLFQMLARSEKIIVPSIKVKKELLSINQLMDTRIKVIPYGVPEDMISDIKTPTKKKFFLVVGMNHPIKNHKILPMDKYNFFIANNVSRRQLKVLYQQAIALVTTSLYESFNLPVLEALAQGCPVIGLSSAIIPELASYVNIFQDKKELTTLLQLAINNKLKKPSIKEIQDKFSWKKYVTNIRIILSK